MKRTLSILLAGAVSVAAADPGPLAGLKAGVFDPPRMAPDFTAQGSNGEPVTLSQFRGKLVLLEFGYTSCADVCPTSLAMLAQARRRLGPKAGQLQVLYLSVDPERDTPQRLRDHLRAFDPTFIGVTGTPRQMAAIRRDYGVSAAKKPIEGSKDYMVEHSSFLYFVDTRGGLRALLPYGRTAGDVAHDAALLLKY